MGTLDGYGVLVTGGGTGIGRACAAALAADGASVTICGRTEDRLQAAVGAIDGDVGYVVADVTVEDQVQGALAATVERAGALTGVVANAGGGGAIMPLHLQDTDEFVRVLHLNALSTFLCVKHAVPLMVANGGGSFVGMSSIAGHVTHLDFGAYPVAKAGIEQLMRNAADEFGPSRLRFNAIRPGFIATEIMEGVPRDSETYESYIVNTPLGDVGQPGDVGALARFLIGPESRWITGQCINVDGGHSLRRGPDFSPFIADALGPEVMGGALPSD
ncbi:MAG: SDR family oxidoreductase [Acidimicrobiia bacterium]|nr:SDR family oxidoreductase [Acidimicrobiia bacterium]